jgi:hypothetical protein
MNIFDKTKNQMDQIFKTSQANKPNLPSMPFMNNNFKPFDIKNFNTLVEKAKNIITCDSNCQKQKQTEELKQKYLAAKTNLSSASYQLEDAEKKYVIFTEGELAYNNKKQEELRNKSKLITSKFNDNFKNDAKIIHSKINSYDSISNNVKNILELYKKYKVENTILKKQMNDKSSDVLTNERKTYYENQDIDNLKFWYHYIALSAYSIFVMAYAFNAFLYSSQLSWTRRIVILILLILLPFLSPYVLAFIITIIYKIFTLFPKNVEYQNIK